MKLSVLGAAKEVGRSAFLVTCSNTDILLDYGVLLKKEPLFPMHVRPKDVDTVILSHAHLDHSGYIPSLFLSSSNTSVLATPPTFELSQLLIEDMIKISGIFLPFEYLDLVNMINHRKELNYREKHTINNVNDVNITLHESGHIIGGASIILEHQGKHLFYTGDINTRGSKLLRPADLDLPKLDIMIIESTYSQTEQMPRDESERRLLEFAYEIVENGGVLFIPAFSVERAQEIATVLKTYDFKYKVAMDGMALKVNEIMLKYTSYLRDPQIFRKAVSEAEWIHGWQRRKQLVKEPGVIISPAGMLVGGSAVFYMQEVCRNPKNGIAIVSYQGEGTPGRTLMDRKIVTSDGKITKCLAKVRQFEFSGHNSRSELFEILDRIKGNPEILTVHGDGNSCIKFAEEIKEKYGFSTRAPSQGDVIEVN